MPSVALRGVASGRGPVGRQAIVLFLILPCVASQNLLRNEFPAFSALSTTTLAPTTTEPPVTSTLRTMPPTSSFAAAAPPASVAATAAEGDGLASPGALGTGLAGTAGASASSATAGATPASAGASPAVAGASPAVAGASPAAAGSAPIAAGGAPGAGKGKVGAGNQLSFLPSTPTRSKPEGRGLFDFSSFSPGDLMAPLKWAQELVVIGAVIGGVAVLWHFRSQVLVLLSGDDRIHGSVLDFLWFGFFKCCGLCSHDWSRIFTCCPCCPGSIRGANLVRMGGAHLGLATTTVEISNLVVGDLPYDGGQGDFYLHFECSSNPPQKTALSENRFPKIVHFPEVITLKLRDHFLEQQVRIMVCELNLVGSQELCDITLNAQSIIDWAKDSGSQTKRFAMKPIDRGRECETPPWIALDFDRPKSDFRNLEHWSGDMATVRTATWDVKNQQTGGGYTDLGMTPFKHKYKLVDSSGNYVQEPEENDLFALHCFRMLVLFIYSVINLAIGGLVIGWSIFRLYVWSCYTHFEQLTIAANWQQPKLAFPMSTFNLHRLAVYCKAKLEGTGILAGADVCRPSLEQVEEVCVNVPAGQPRPTALTGAFERLSGIKLEGVPCAEGICKFRNQIHQYDLYIWGGCAILLIWSLCCFRPCANRWIENKKKSFKRKAGGDARQTTRS